MGYFDTLFVTKSRRKRQDEYIEKQTMKRIGNEIITLVLEPVEKLGLKKHVIYNIEYNKHLIDYINSKGIHCYYNDHNYHFQWEY